MSVARFDEETQSDFTRLYEKIDVKVELPEETETTNGSLLLWRTTNAPID